MVYIATIKQLEDWKSELESEINNRYSSLDRAEFDFIFHKQNTINRVKSNLEMRENSSLAKSTLIEALQKDVSEKYSSLDNNVVDQLTKVKLDEIKVYEELIADVEITIQNLKESEN